MTTNGFQADQLEQLLPEPLAPKEITGLVDAHERFTEPLRTRMEDDWSLAVLDEFDAGEGYQSYTTTEPYAYNNKITSMIATGQIKIRIPVVNKLKPDRQKQDGKERFLSGILAANDERLERMNQPPLLDQLAGFVNIRGWLCGRCMFVKDPETGDTYFDATPYDPLHTSFAVGLTGLKWICLKSKKTLDEIEDEYGVTLKNRHRFNMGPIHLGAQSEEEGIDVYAFTDQTYDYVVVDGAYIKEPTPHGSPRTPGFIKAVSYLPLIQSRNKGRKDNVVHYGESIFGGARDVYPKISLIMSAMLQLVALSRDQAFTYTSRDGNKTLDENPFLEGSQVPLAEGESINIIPLLEMSKDTAEFMGLVSGEIQRLNLPYSVYGQLAFQLSGYAVNLLKQATESPITPRKQAIESVYRQICNLASDQYATRAFDPLSLSGFDKNRDWFDEEFTPDVIIGVGQPVITLVVMTPQDELQRIQMAIALDQAHMLPKRIIWDETLERQDTDQLAKELKEQRSEELLPAATLFTHGSALLEQAIDNGQVVDEEKLALAMIYLKAAAFADMTGTLGPMLGGQGTESNVPGFSPENLSPPEQGAPTPQPNQQQGPISPAGTPRSGGA